MANQSYDAPQAWVWSEYRGFVADDAPVQGVAAATPEIDATPIAESVQESTSVAPAPAAREGGNATAPILAALILAILGLLGFASSDKKSEATNEKSAPPSVVAEPAPAPAPPAASAPPVVAVPAEPAPTATPTAPATGSEQHAPHHRQRRHR